MVTLADLVNRVITELFAANEYMSLDDVLNAVIQAVNLRTLEARPSSTNVLLTTSDEFTPTVSPYDITSLIHKGTPEWLEMRYTTVLGTEWWRPVRVVPFSQLNEYAQMGYFACSIWAEEPTDNGPAATQNLSFTYLPFGPCRLRFDQDSVRKSLSDDILMPDNLSELPVKEAQQSLIPRIQFELGRRMRSDEEGRKDAQVILAGLDKIWVQNALDIKALEASWKVWAFRDRSADVSFTKPNPRGSLLYGQSNRWRTGGGY